METPKYENAVFINCPFDKRYQPILQAIIYSVYRYGFFPRTALEEDDTLESRLHKIMRLIRRCKYGIHDISRIPGSICPMSWGFSSVQNIMDQAYKKRNKRWYLKKISFLTRNSFLTSTE